MLELHRLTHEKKKKKKGGYLARKKSQGKGGVKTDNQWGHTGGGGMPRECRILKRGKDRGRCKSKRKRGRIISYEERRLLE